jgi:protocatechuate 3,4-dioxygenase beta subunit
MAQSPKVLFLIGMLAFSAALVWKYLEDRGQAPYAVPAEPAATSPESTVESASSSTSTPGSAATGTEDRPNPQARSQETHASRTESSRNGGESRTPTYRAPRTTPQEAEAETIDPAARFSISGRVLGPGGTPVSGIMITATHRTVAGGSRDNKVHEARSDASGNYEISGLLQGEYYVRTAATASYPTTGTNFRAGMRSADITLTGSQTVQIIGRVTDTAGYALVDVAVKPSGRDSVTVWTDATGNFRTQAPGVRPGTTFSVLFSRDGYLEERAYIKYDDINVKGEARLDVQLLDLDGTVKVSGVLRGADGKMVAGESVQLDSPSLDNRYREISQPDGSFVFPAVEPGGDYRLSIHPRSAYESYYEQSISIQPPSANLSVTLQPMETGRLTGRMMDTEGRAMGGFSMTLRSNKSQSNYVEVTGDDNGYFTVDKAPAGNLVFATRSRPQFTISGVTLEPGGSVHADLVIDWGDLDFTGRVIDDSRNPMPGVDVRLSGRYVGNGIQSSSLRRTVTDTDGYFRFTQLGSGPHRLDVVAKGFQGITQNHDIEAFTVEVKVVLERLDGQGD